MNRMDTRERRADEIFAELRGTKGFKLAVLGSHSLDASAVADALLEQRDSIIELVGEKPVRLLTGCAPVGVEKAARLAAKKFTGKLAVIIHRAELTYGKKPAEQMRDILLAQESDALLLLGGGNKHARDRFSGHGKKVYEIEIG